MNIKPTSLVTKKKKSKIRKKSNKIITKRARGNKKKIIKTYERRPDNNKAATKALYTKLKIAKR